MDQVRDRPPRLSWHRPDRMLWRALTGAPHAIHRSLVRHLRPSKTEDNVEAQKLEPPRKGQPAFSGPAPQPRTLATLPPELLICIVEHLNYGDIVSLQRSSRTFRRLITPSVVRSLNKASGAGFADFLIQHCRECQAHVPQPTKRLFTHAGMRDFPRSSFCVPCARRHYGTKGFVLGYHDVYFRPGGRIRLGDGLDHWVCRWCVWPVAEWRAMSSMSNGPYTWAPRKHFHTRCYVSYSARMVCFWAAGVGQVVLAIMGQAITGDFFRHENLVFWPSLVALVATFLACFAVVWKPPEWRTYAKGAIAELVVLGLWVVPCYKLILIRYYGGGAKLPFGTDFTLRVVLAIVAFHVLNVAGNIFLLLRCSLPHKSAPGVFFVWRVLYMLAAPFSFWMYPKFVEQKYPFNWE